MKIITKTEKNKRIELSNCNYFKKKWGVWVVSYTVVAFMRSVIGDLRFYIIGKKRFFILRRYQYRAFQHLLPEKSPDTINQTIKKRITRIDVMDFSKYGIPALVVEKNLFVETK